MRATLLSMALTVTGLLAGCGGDDALELCDVVEDRTTGACLLEYNNDYVDQNGELCCFRWGGTNNCDTGIQCPAGETCSECVIYGGAGTTAEGCCLYDDGSEPDPGSVEACDVLLDSSTTSRVTCS